MYQDDLGCDSYFKFHSHEEQSILLICSVEKESRIFIYIFNIVIFTFI